MIVGLFLTIGAWILAGQSLFAGDFGGLAGWGGLALILTLGIYVNLRHSVAGIRRDQFWSGWK